MIGVRHALARGAGRNSVPVGSAVLWGRAGGVRFVRRCRLRLQPHAPRTRTTPSLYGQQFDAWFSINQTGSSSQNRQMLASLERPGIRSITEGTGGDVTINGHAVRPSCCPEPPRPLPHHPDQRPDPCGERGHTRLHHVAAGRCARRVTGQRQHGRICGSYGVTYVPRHRHGRVPSRLRESRSGHGRRFHPRWVSGLPVPSGQGTAGLRAPNRDRPGWLLRCAGRSWRTGPSGLGAACRGLPLGDQFPDAAYQPGQLRRVGELPADLRSGGRPFRHGDVDPLPCRQRGPATARDRPLEGTWLRAAAGRVSRCRGRRRRSWSSAS